MNIENKPKIKTVWNIEDGDNYYYLDSNGCVCIDTFKNYPIDIRVREIGNMFLSQEEAEFELERRKIEFIIKKYSRFFNKEKDNWFIYYDPSMSGIKIGEDYIAESVYYFETKEAAQKVIDEIGEERLLKYWFGIEEGCKRCEFCGNEDVDYKSKNIYVCRNCEDELLEYLEANNLIKTEKETVTHYFDVMGNYINDTFNQSTEEIIANMVDDESIDLERI